MNLKKGQVFSIKTDKGYGFMQYIETDKLGIEYVRILSPIKDSEELNQTDTNAEQRWCCGFPLKAAFNRKLVNFIGDFKLPPNYQIEYWTRSPVNIRGEHLGWHIVHRNTLKREFHERLKKKHLTFSPHGVCNDTVIIERLESDWKLADWL